MRWAGWRRSDAVEDYRDPNKPLNETDLTDYYNSINEQLKITNSTLADDAGAKDIPLLKMKLVSNWKSAHRMGSVQLSIFFSLLNGGVIGLQAFMGIINPWWFLVLNLVGYVLIGLVRLVYQPKVHADE